MLVLFRTHNEDWKRFQRTLLDHEKEIRSLGCTRIEAYRNRKHLDEWVMVQEWPDKESFDRFAKTRGPELDKLAGVRWTDVSTWLESAF
jgi:quinol monooxygenase YgiN